MSTDAFSSMFGDSSTGPTIPGVAELTINVNDSSFDDFFATVETPAPVALGGPAKPLGSPAEPITISGYDSSAEPIVIDAMIPRPESPDSMVGDDDDRMEVDTESVVSAVSDAPSLVSEATTVAADGATPAAKPRASIHSTMVEYLVGTCDARLNDDTKSMVGDFMIALSDVMLEVISIVHRARKNKTVEPCDVLNAALIKLPTAISSIIEAKLQGDVECGFPVAFAKRFLVSKFGKERIAANTVKGFAILIEHIAMEVLTASTDKMDQRLSRDVAAEKHMTHFDVIEAFGASPLSDLASCINFRVEFARNTALPAAPIARFLKHIAASLGDPTMQVSADAVDFIKTLIESELTELIDFANVVRCVDVKKVKGVPTTRVTLKASDIKIVFSILGINVDPDAPIDAELAKNLPADETVKRIINTSGCARVASGCTGLFAAYFNVRLSELARKAVLMLRSMGQRKLSVNHLQLALSIEGKHMSKIPLAAKLERKEKSPKKTKKTKKSE